MSRGMVARAMRKVTESAVTATFLQADAHALPFADASFDVAMCEWWGVRGLWRVMRSEQIFRSKHLGYGIIAGRKPG
jgi:hypothetical protein